MRKTLFGILLIFTALVGFSQERVLTFGLQFKPLIPEDIFTDRTTTVFENNINFSLNTNVGYSFGGVIRRGITDKISFETGINYVSRNFNLSVEDEDNAFSGTTDFTIVGYEIPALGLVYVQLDQQIFMNAALGASLDFFPSDVGTRTDELFHISQRKAWFMPSILANLGWEYRTKTKGYWYLGASFHRPFTNIYFTGVRYSSPVENTESTFQLVGSYLTFDLRYFFHEKPQPKKTKEASQPVKDIKYYRKLQKQREKQNK